MSSMTWGDEPPAAVTERQYAEWQAKKRGITLPSPEQIAQMKAEEGIAPAPDDSTPAGTITSALLLAVCFIGTIITGFAIVSAVISAVGG
jgi:hypothetical protein